MRVAKPALWLAALIGLPAFTAWAQTGVAPVPGPVKIGISTPLSGPDGARGQALLQGLKAGLLNAEAAVELLALDDAGQPSRTLANTKALLQQGVVALTGFHGAANIEAALPVLEPAGVPMVGVSSSSEGLREPARRWLFNLRAGAADETAALIYHLDTLGLTEVAVVAQSDGLGKATSEGVKHQLTRIGIRPVAMEGLTSQAGSAEVRAVMSRVCAAKPAAVVLAVSPQLALAAVRAARGMGCRMVFEVLSETGSEMARNPDETGELVGLVVSQVLPSPRSPHALATQAQRDLTRAGGANAPPLSYASLEGYLYGRVLTEALRSCGKRSTPECLISALEGRKLDVAGYALQFGGGERRGSRFVELTMLDAQGRFRR
ncbi:ABC transporter substrate-binding protein [Ideonella sp.]|uniref:ABC transporter substrate-binding protein n=1 Tax=Ideonella sp. TaxID=1929293 RepID=UPI003BB74400